MATAEPSEEAVKQRAALNRAMSITRMLDYGMDHWDASELAGSPASAPWQEVATRLAEAQIARADKAVEQGNRVTAAACYRRAAAALIFAQMAFNTDTPVKRSLYERMCTAYKAAASVDDALHVEPLTVPFAGSHCAAWVIRPSPQQQPVPAVIIVGGQSGWGPAYHKQAEALARRGLCTVLFEAPGQGQTRMTGGLHLDATSDRAFSAVLDAVQAHTGYEGPSGVWGNSFGGLLAARAAVHDSRFHACCVNGSTATPEPLPFRTAREQSQALLGVDTDDEAAVVFRGLWLDSKIDRMSAALLVLHGAADPLVTREQQEAFLPMSALATMRIWDDGEHTIYNHSNERTEFVADWFRAQLVRG
ncbi:MAG: dipeptidyl aminopeptidase/acylaminoacyl-peptidase-like protein [Frankiales bacterium]|nr:dipeptidyl aminopeptidase/acylaminoacyl-peptidase-like protein [Frankiales bacterium]